MEASRRVQFCSSTNLQRKIVFHVLETDFDRKSDLKCEISASCVSLTFLLAEKCQILVKKSNRKLAKRVTSVSTRKKVNKIVNNDFSKSFRAHESKSLRRTLSLVLKILTLVSKIPCSLLYNQTKRIQFNAKFNAKTQLLEDDDRRLAFEVKHQVIEGIKFANDYKITNSITEGSVMRISYEWTQRDLSLTHGLHGAQWVLTLQCPIWQCTRDVQVVYQDLSHVTLPDYMTPCAKTLKQQPKDPASCVCLSTPFKKKYNNPLIKKNSKLEKKLKKLKI